MKPGDFVKKNSNHTSAKIWNVPYESDSDNENDIRDIVDDEMFLIIAVDDDLHDAFILATNGNVGYVWKKHLNLL